MPTENIATVLLRDVLDSPITEEPTHRQSKMEIARGDHIVISDKAGNLHAIVLGTRYNETNVEWEITVATLAQNDGTPVVQRRTIGSSQINPSNKETLGGKLDVEELEMAASRAEFLEENPQLVSSSPAQYGSECFAVWCRVGQWKPCIITQDAISLAHDSSLVEYGAYTGTAITGIITGMVSGTPVVGAGAGGLYGTLVGGIAAIPLLGPILLPTVLAGTAGLCYAYVYMCGENRTNVEIWAEYEEKLNKEYVCWRDAQHGVYWRDAQQSF